MTDGDLTIAILREIRDEIRKTNERLGSTNERLDATNERLDRVVHEQIRHATAIVDLERKTSEGFQRTAEGFDALIHEIRTLNGRLDSVLIGPMGNQVRDHEDRIKRLEERSPTPRRQAPRPRR